MQYSTKTIIFAILVSVNLVQGVAIGKGTEIETSSSAVVVNPNPNNGFVVQSGYEGYLVSPQKTSVGSWLAPSKINMLRSILLPASSLVLAYGVKAFGLVLHLLLALLLGAVATTAACTFTPLCTISLAGPAFSLLKGQSVKDQVAELARTYMTPENVEMATRLVQSALDKYSSTQQRKVEQPQQPSDEENESN